MTLRERGHGVRVVTLTDEPVVSRTGGLVRFPRRWPWPLRTIAVIAWMLRHRRSYGVVYATGLHTEALIGSALAGRPLAVKIVGDPAWERGVRQGLTTLDFDSFQQARNGGPRLRMMRALRSWTVQRAATVVVPSTHLAAVVSRWGAQQVTVIPNGVRVPPRARPSRHERTGRLRVITVSRLVPHKRLDILIESAAAAGVEMDIVGDGPDRLRLKEQIERHDAADRVRLVGDLPHENTLALVAEADVFAMASEYEGLPHAVIESLAVGTPVVSAPTGGIAEVVRDGIDGMLVDPPTVVGFTSVLRRLDRDRSALDALAAGTAEAPEQWNFDSCADRIVSLLRELPGTHGRDVRPGAVFLGKTEIPRELGVDLRSKLALHAAHLRQVSVNIGPPGVRRIEGTTVVTLPALRPRILGGLAFYSLGPVVAVAVATSGRRAIVCQSPFEAIGVVILSRAVPPARRPPVQVELHGDWRTAARLYGHPGRRVVAPVSDRMAGWALRRADRVRAVSERLEELARESGYTGPIDRFVTFSDFAAFLNQPPAPLPPTPHALFAGVFERYKAVDVLLDAWPDVLSRLPDATLTCVGDGARASELAARVADPQLRQSVVLLPTVSRPELIGLMDHATCLVLPSRSEGLARIVLEAMARGRAVVASDVGGIREVLDDGVHGRIVPSEDATALADALVEVLSDPARCAAMGAAARERAEHRAPTSEYAAGIERLACWISTRTGP